ncbi:MAG: hypothetical protein O3A63_13875 [Proteobacteria bacterium]|nr:hypothetical protein [Pseudomonadota bacterium]
MEKLTEFLDRPLIELADQTITIGQVLLVPTIVIVGLILVRWAGGAIRTSLAGRGVNADVVQLVSRAFYVVCIANHRNHHA